jgi:hypothetical protein
LIDITFGIGKFEGDEFVTEFNPIWFTQTPEEFKRSHYDYDLNETDTKKNIAKRPYVRPPYIKNEWYRTFIDCGSIKPATHQLKGLVKWTFQLAVRCSHFDWKFPAFAIKIGEDADNVVIPFVKQGNGAALNWVAEFDPSEQEVSFIDQLKKAASTDVRLVCYYADTNKLMLGEPMPAGSDISKGVCDPQEITWWELEA